MASATAFALRIFQVLYSGLAILLLGGRAAVEGYTTRCPTRGYWEEVERTREKIWNLNAEPISSFKHAFHTSETTGLKIHYLTNDPSPEKPTKAKTLALFIHGFPDSAMLWSRVFEHLPGADMQKTRLVAMDQPGFGASDSLPAYHPDFLLEAIADFLLAMRETYLDDSDDNHVIIAGHDWGAFIAFRLADEAPQLADRFLISNAAIRRHALSNFQRRLLTTQKMLKSYFRQPSNFKILQAAWLTIRPLLQQLRNSSYIFIYNCYQPIPIAFLLVGHYWFPRFAAVCAVGGRPTETIVPSAPVEINALAAAAHFASCQGPNASNLHTTTVTGEGYPRSVQARAKSWAAPWIENTRIYSEGLALRRWTKSVRVLAALHDLDIVSSQRRKSQPTGARGLVEKDRRGALKAPTTVIWGLLDPALDRHICIDGIEEWFTVKRSQVVTLDRVGHWTPCDSEGPKHWAKILSWTINGEEGVLDAGPGSKITAST